MSGNSTRMSGKCTMMSGKGTRSTGLGIEERACSRGGCGAPRTARTNTKYHERGRPEPYAAARAVVQKPPSTQRGLGATRRAWKRRRITAAYAVASQSLHSARAKYAGTAKKKKKLKKKGSCLRRCCKPPARAGAAISADGALDGGPLHRQALRVEKEQELVQEGEQQGLGIVACADGNKHHPTIFLQGGQV